MKIESLDPRMRMLLACIPQRNEAVEWVEEKGRVVLIYPKNFTRFERFLHKHIGGPENIRRPLDDKGTFIWKMCDGEHNVHEICQDSYAQFKEDIEPVVRRVWGFLERLHELNLVAIKVVKEEKPKIQDGGVQAEGAGPNSGKLGQKEEDRTRKMKQEKMKTGSHKVDDEGCKKG